MSSRALPSENLLFDVKSHATFKPIPSAREVRDGCWCRCWCWCSPPLDFQKVSANISITTAIPNVTKPTTPIKKGFESGFPATPNALKRYIDARAVTTPKTPWIFSLFFNLMMARFLQERPSPLSSLGTTILHTEIAMIKDK